MKLWKVWQVALELEVPVSTVKAWIRQNKLEVVRLGPNTIRVPQTEIDRLLAAGQGAARSAEPAARPRSLNERD